MQSGSIPAFLKLCVGAVLLTLVWSGIHPHDYPTWVLEVAPIILALPILMYTYPQFHFTPLVYGLIALHMIILAVGGHYTYAHVPLFDWLKELLGFTRNHYDRLGHFIQGFVPAMVARELLLRTSPLKPGKWLFALIVLGCTGISAIYELIEWVVDIFSEGGAGEFLGTQGDIWDTQKDMLMAMLGAATALLLLAPIHNKQLTNLGSGKRKR